MEQNSVIQIQIQLKKDEIIDAASRLVKDHDSVVVRGMTEVSNRLLSELDSRLAELDSLKTQLK